MNEIEIELEMDILNKVEVLEKQVVNYEGLTKSLNGRVAEYEFLIAELLKVGKQLEEALRSSKEEAEIYKDELVKVSKRCELYELAKKPTTIELIDEAQELGIKFTINLRVIKEDLELSNIKVIDFLNKMKTIQEYVPNEVFYDNLDNGEVI